MDITYMGIMRMKFEVEEAKFNVSKLIELSNIIASNDKYELEDVKTNSFVPDEVKNNKYADCSSRISVKIPKEYKEFEISIIRDKNKTTIITGLYINVSGLCVTEKDFKDIVELVLSVLDLKIIEDNRIYKLYNKR